MFVPELTRAILPGQGGARRGRRRDPPHGARRTAIRRVQFVQFDEPVLTEVAFAPGRTRTFMCAALAARKDPAEELEFAVSLINRVVAGVDDLRLGLHVCRGNWSRTRRRFLSGDYQPLRTYLDRLQDHAARPGIRHRAGGPTHRIRGQGASGWASSTLDPPGRGAGAHSVPPSKMRYVSIPPNAYSSILTAGSARSRTVR